jgi:hypothetical protein
MLKQPYCFIITALIFVGIQIVPCFADTLAITPFYTFNQSPLVQIFGLPAAESSIIEPPGHTWSLLAVDAANNFASQETDQENVYLDGESYRLTLALRYGITDKLEIGVDLPWVGYGGGIFDSFIEGWHRFFGLSQGGRTQAPLNRLLFTYSRDGQERLRLDDSNFGIGDIRLTSGWQLYNDGSSHPLAVALRASLKLPTGDSSRLHGSGSTDVALWLTGSDDYPLPGPWGDITLFGAAGGMVMTDGQVLKEQQKNLAGFGSLGFGWSPADWIALKTQFSLHTPFYRSELRELGQPAVQFLIGGTWGLSAKTALDIAVSEDVSVDTSPDVALHLGLNHQF